MNLIIPCLIAGHSVLVFGQFVDVMVAMAMVVPPQLPFDMLLQIACEGV